MVEKSSWPLLQSHLAKEKKSLQKGTSGLLHGAGPPFLCTCYDTYIGVYRLRERATNDRWMYFVA